jgi:hypothetical protein
MGSCLITSLSLLYLEYLLCNGCSLICPNQLRSASAIKKQRDCIAISLLFILTIYLILRSSKPATSQLRQSHLQVEELSDFLIRHCRELAHPARQDAQLAHQAHQNSYH